MKSEWADADEQLPGLESNGTSRPVLVHAGADVPAQLVRESSGQLWWHPLDGSSPIPEPKPEGVAGQRWVRRWRFLPEE